jgi:hypothetical protein
VKKIYVPSLGTCSWRTLLADPTAHWKRGASAMELAVSWEAAARTPRGLPDAVATVLDQHPTTRGSELLFGIPEHRVALPGGSRASQTDLWAVLRTSDGWASAAVEGKARESLGPTINEWLREPTPGRRTRLDSLCGTLGLGRIEACDLRYQVFHRAASAVIEASRIGAQTAILIVQNFYGESSAWPDFEAFVNSSARRRLEMAFARRGAPALSVCCSPGPTEVDTDAQVALTV